MKLESEKRRKEEEKQRKEEEKRLKEEEKRKKKEEEERKKAEEKKRKEEEKQRLEDEKRRKKEEEKRRKEKEAERKREEKRLKEEEEKRRKEEEKLKKEDENRKKEEEKQLKEQEKKRIVEGQTLKEESHRNDSGISKEETKQKETSEQDLSLDLTKKDRSKDNKEIGHEIDKENFTKIQNDEKVIANIEAEVNDGSHNKLTYGSHISDNMKESKQNKFDNKNINDGRNLVSKSGKLEEIIGNVNRIENDLAARAKLGSSNEMKEGKSPRVPHPPLSPKKKQQDLSKDVLKR